MVRDEAKQVLPLLGEAFRAVAPLLAPLLSGLGKLLSGLLPGHVMIQVTAGPYAGKRLQVPEAEASKERLDARAI